MALTREDVISVLGSADDATIAEIMATGASREELVEAYAWITSDEALVNSGRPLPAGRVGDLVEILATVEDEDDEDDPLGSTDDF